MKVFERVRRLRSPALASSRQSAVRVRKVVNGYQGRRVEWSNAFRLSPTVGDTFTPFHDSPEHSNNESEPHGVRKQRVDIHGETTFVLDSLRV